MPTVFAARQFVNHGHVKVNGQRVTIPSYRRSRSATSSRSARSRSRWRWCIEATGLGERDVPDYIEADHNKMTAKLARVPAHGRSALPGTDGAASGRRILFALIHSYGFKTKPPASAGGFLFVIIPTHSASCPRRRASSTPMPRPNARRTGFRTALRAFRNDGGESVAANKKGLSLLPRPGFTYVYCEA